MIKPKIFDVRGRACPQPLMIVKGELRSISVGEGFEVWLDNDTSCTNVARFLEQAGCAVEVTNRDEVLVIQALKHSGASESIVCDERAGSAGDYVLVLAQDTMGQGDADLGRLLMQGAMNALRDVQPNPSSIVFYNSGVKLACEDSQVLEVLNELSGRGVRLLVCGTCLNFFELKDKLRVGQVSNMFEILEMVARAGHTFRP